MLMLPDVVRLTGREIPEYFSTRYKDRASPATASGITPARTALVWSPLTFMGLLANNFLHQLVGNVTTGGRHKYLILVSFIFCGKAFDLVLKWKVLLFV